jgi:hypothetical protein
MQKANGNKDISEATVEKQKEKAGLGETCLRKFNLE